MKKIDGGLTRVKNIKTSGSKKDGYGLGVIYSKDSTAAGVFTSNNICASSVALSKDNIANGKISAVVVNSGNANCFTGKSGYSNSYKIMETLAEKLDIGVNDIVIGATGVIGRQLSMDTINDLIEINVNDLNDSIGSSTDFANSIITTDTYPKEFAVETSLKTGELIRIGGVTKGSGMLAPNMATTLTYIVTDISASHSELEESLKIAVDQSFNMCSVDGDESTNDMVVILCTGDSGEIDENFQEALNYLCRELSKMLVKDGEGATKFFEVEVVSAKSDHDARLVAKSVVSSSLLKAAIFGADPNWGRIIMAIGYSGAIISEDDLSIDICSLDVDENIKDKVSVVVSGEPKALDGTDELVAAENIMKNSMIRILIDLGLNNGSAIAYGCDLTYDYVKINAEYTS